MNNPILIVGAPRSGTSLTTRIVQSHIGEDFPFDVTRHAEPVELVDAITAWLERRGMSFYDRLYFPWEKPDMELFHDLTDFFYKINGLKVAIKEPAFSVIKEWYQVDAMWPTIYVKREHDGIVGSLIHHKKYEKEKADKIVQFYEDNIINFDYMIEFSSDREKYMSQLKSVLDKLNIEWQQNIFDRYWDSEQIEYYKI